MHIALLNANTSVSMTERMTAAALQELPAGWTIEAMTAPFGSPYISSREASATASHAIVEMAHTLRGHSRRPSAVLIACFGDPGLWAAREILDCPVIGMADASCHTACQLGQRFSIITGGAGWRAMLTEFVTLIGLLPRLSSIRTVTLTGLELAARPLEAMDLLEGEVRAAFDQDEADTVILGGAGLIGFSSPLRKKLNRPVIDSLQAAVRQTIALAQLP